MSSQNNDKPEGFKTTELGLLPEDWDVASLGNVLIEVDTRATEFHDQDKAMLPVLSLTKNHGLMLQSERFGKRIALEDISDYKVVRKGEIVYNPYVIWEGAIHILNRFDYGLVSPVYPVFKANPQHAVSYFLDPLLRTPLAMSAYNRFAAGAVNRRRSIRKTDFKAIRIPLPPLPEQKSIAYVLSTIQKAIEAQDKILAAAREMKKSLMHYLFTYGPVPVAEAEQVLLKETEIGLVPEHWEVMKLGDIIEKPEYGYTATASSENVGPKFLRITDIQNGRVAWTSVPYCQCSPTKVEKYKLLSGDVLFARIGATTGKTFLVEECPSSIFASYLIRVRCKSSLLPAYLSQFTNTQNYWNQINASKGGRLKQGINIPVLKSLLIPFPSLVEQLEIALMLSAVDKKIGAEENRKATFQSLFQTMLHHLMIGKVRVNNMEAKVS